mmetsp:Transcript_30483/g.79353  ORF Transcript_30483/g.79353 Transcript_30483/m.79353 type:complete len:136 (+) Transcript_30483:147-554(+)
METTKKIGSGIYGATKGVCKGTYNFTRDAVVYTGGVVYKGGKKMGDAAWGSSTTSAPNRSSSGRSSTNMGKKLSEAAASTYQVGAAGIGAVGKPIVKGGKNMVGYVSPSMKSKMNGGYVPMSDTRQWRAQDECNI